MRILKKIFAWAIGIVAVLYIAVCIFFYSKQDDILFVPTKLEADYKFTFPGNYTERKIKTADGIILSGLLFKSDSSKGLIFYLHGNGGCLNSWGDIANVYTGMGYDIFMLDYRGYGKSEGKITSEAQLYGDVQTAYNDLKTLYPENKIILLGYSIGTGPAAMLAAHNKPKMLILQAPYYSMTDMLRKTYPFLPTFMLKYPLRTYEFVKATTAPMIIFHGDADEVLYYGSSLKLKAYFKTGDTLITLPGQGHSGITRNPEYLADLKKILE
jgi:alpha-beta hydrolase superfamily lysophospholipase